MQDKLIELWRHVSRPSLSGLYNLLSSPISVPLSMTNIASGVMKHGYTQHQCVSPTIRYSEHGHIGHSSSQLTCHRTVAATSSSSSRGTSSLCSDPRWSRQHLREMTRAARRGGGPPLLSQETHGHHLEVKEQIRESKWEGVLCNENNHDCPHMLISYFQGGQNRPHLILSQTHQVCLLDHQIFQRIRWKIREKSFSSLTYWKMQMKRKKRWDFDSN